MDGLTTNFTDHIGDPTHELIIHINGSHDERYDCYSKNNLENIIGSIVAVHSSQNLPNKLKRWIVPEQKLRKYATLKSDVEK